MEENLYSMESILNKIRDYADNAHGEQTRKYTPERYIVHPVRVMETVRQYDPRLPMLAAALLHDVLEDTPVTEDEMMAFLLTVMERSDAERTLELVIEMTDVYVWKTFPQWNRRVRKQKELERIALTSPDAQTIKYADIMDNSMEIADEDTDFAPRYLNECLAILKVADKGNPELYRRSLDTVREALRSVERQ